MLKIALTGNIASGKTSVCSLLEAEAPVLDADLVCHKLLETSESIKEAFANYDVFDNGEISREKLGKLIFSNENLKQMLENLLYPDLIKEIQAFFEENSENKFCVVAIPQLFEAGMENLFDIIILVYCRNDIRLERLIKRNNYSVEYAKIRMAAQISQDEKIKKSGYVIYNNSTFEHLETEVRRLVEQIRLTQGR